MVTQPGREAFCKASVQSFAAQTFEPRELVIVHDGDDLFADELSATARDFPEIDILIVREAPGASLGKLRNVSLDAARYDVVCQWDDDDLSHPDRLAVQHRHFDASRAEVCFLTDQLHLFAKNGLLFWDDWSIEPWPLNMIPGTLMGNKLSLGTYPELSLGEDSELVFRLVNEGCRISTLADAGWLYLYVYHGANAWDESHHKTISLLKRRGEAALSEKLDLLRSVLPEFKLSCQSLTMLHESGRFTIDLQPAAAPEGANRRPPDCD